MTLTPIFVVTVSVPAMVLRIVHVVLPCWHFQDQDLLQVKQLHMTGLSTRCEAVQLPDG